MAWQKIRESYKITQPAPHKNHGDIALELDVNFNGDDKRVSIRPSHGGKEFIFSNSKPVVAKAVIAAMQEAVNLADKVTRKRSTAHGRTNTRAKARTDTRKKAR